MLKQLYSVADSDAVVAIGWRREKKAHYSAISPAKRLGKRQDVNGNAPLPMLADPALMVCVARAEHDEGNRTGA
jgi:hypothetical protein